MTACQANSISTSISISIFEHAAEIATEIVFDDKTAECDENQNVRDDSAAAEKILDVSDVFGRFRAFSDVFGHFRTFSHVFERFGPLLDNHSTK